MFICVHLWLKTVFQALFPNLQSPISGEHIVTAKWLGADAVEITGLTPGGDKAYKSEQSVGGITVVYR